jgi:short-subunit dehydrogenase
MSMQLTQDAVIIITGASSGIGEALAYTCADRGLRIALVARRVERLREVAHVARDRGAEVLECPADVSVSTEARAVITSTLERFGRVDALVNNAGRGNLASVEDTTDDMLRSVFAVNTFSAFHTTAAVLPHMKERGTGHIVNIASVAGKYAFPFNAAYVAAKHAVVGFTASLRAELYGSGVQATVVCPDGVITEWGGATEGGPISALFTEGIKRSRMIARERGLGLAPLKHMMKAEDAAAIILRTIESDHTNDVFTHDGTHELSVLAAQDRSAFEQQMAALYLGMQHAYEERVSHD